MRKVHLFNQLLMVIISHFAHGSQQNITRKHITQKVNSVSKFQKHESFQQRVWHACSVRSH